MTTASSNTPTLWEALHRFVNEVASSWFTSIPAEVVDYDPVKQKLSAQPLIMGIERNEEGERVAQRLAIINGIPVAFPGGGGFRITFPLEKGDTVLLVMSTFSLDRWKAKGGIVDPEDERRFDISDAVAFPTLRPFVDPWATPPSDGMTIGFDGGPVIKITETQIQAGGTDALALHAKLAILWNHVDALFTGGSGSVNVPIVGTLGNGTQVLKGS